MADDITTPTADPTDLFDACRAVARLSKQLELALAEVDLSLPQYRALAFLSRGTQAPSILAGQLAVSRPSITALIDGLVARRLVERHADLNDRRRVGHTLTADGLRALERADRAVAARLGHLLDHLEGADGARAVVGLRLWHAAIDRSLAPVDQAGPG